MKIYLGWDSRKVGNVNAVRVYNQCHVIMECKLNEEGRNRLRKETEKIWMDEVEGDGNLQFDLNVILAPFSNKSISDSIS